MKPPRRIVVTRSAEGGAAWCRRLEATGSDCLHLPLIRYELLPLPADLDLGAQDWLLFTAPQGVRAFFRDGAAPQEIPALAALNRGSAEALAAVTAAAILDLGALDGAAMAKAFAARISAPARLLLPGPEKRLPEPASGLRLAGFQVSELPVYRTQLLDPAELPEHPFRPGDCIFFASPSAFLAFRRAWPDSAPECVAIGETTAAACRQGGLEPLVAAAPTLEALCETAGLAPPPVIP